MKKLFLIPVLILIFAPLLHAEDKIRVVTTTATLAGLAEEIAGDHAEIHYVASPDRNLHFISPTPRDVLKLKKADVFIHLGLDAEPWRQPLLHAAGRREFLDGSRAIDVSSNVKLLEVPNAGSLTRLEGDIHVFGNPHYWTDPVNAGVMAENIARGFSQLYPEKKEAFETRLQAFLSRLSEARKQWAAAMEPFRGSRIVTYHKTWTYFAQCYGLEIAGQIEPKPGIPPTSRHLAELVSIMKEKKVRFIVKDNAFEDRTPRKLAHETGAAVLELSPEAGGVEEAKDYISLMNYNVRQFEKAAEGGGGEK